jgi:Fur family peroxide stress response transcriptional regulator
VLRLVVLSQAGVAPARGTGSGQVEGEVERRLKDLELACRRAGARVTHQRREVLRAVVETDVHPDAQTVLQRVREHMPTISFDTVYRTLAFLEEHDLIGRVPATGERARFDGNCRPHHHFICTRCGKIVDFESDELDRMSLPERVENLGTPVSRQLQVFGVCRDCESQKGRRSS